tara:strand:+ start:1435 stop:2619 length:1185 start_codon:yes stop_codon:yes gene_type:complete
MTKYNSYYNYFVLSLFFVAPVLFYPVTIVLDSALQNYLVLLFFTFLLLVKDKLITNKKTISYVALLSASFSLVMTYSIFFGLNESLLQIVTIFISYGILYPFVQVKLNSYERFYWCLFPICIFSFIALLSSYFITQVITENYMQFGTSLAMFFMLVTPVFFLARGALKKSTVFLFLFVFMMLVFIFGNRGSLLFVILNVFLAISIFYSKKLAFALIILGFLIFYFIDIVAILDFTIELVTPYSNDTTPLRKLRTILELGFTSIDDASSGRDDIYQMAAKIIKNNGLLPAGVFEFKNITGVTSPHNVILDMLIIFGFFTPFIVFLFLSKFFIKVCEVKNKYELYFVTSLFLFVIVRLSLSSSFLFEPLFYILLAYLFAENESSGFKKKLTRYYKK